MEKHEIDSMTKAELVKRLLRANPFGGYSTKQSKQTLTETLDRYENFGKHSA